MSKKKPLIPSKRPTLEILQEFTNSYFRRNPSKVHGANYIGMDDMLQVWLSAKGTGFTYTQK
jgi:hypothetical protein